MLLAETSAPALLATHRALHLWIHDLLPLHLHTRSYPRGTCKIPRPTPCGGAAVTPIVD